jgi:hypothetical protein
MANAVSLKLPSFWSAQPKIWFQQAEAQFAIRGIVAQQTKYFYVVGALDQEIAGRLIDFLETPPTEDQYTAIKTRLLEIFGLRRRDCAAKLLHMDSLGDRLPSVLMDDMLGLLDGHQPCLLFEQLFLERLPPMLRLQLSDADFADPRKVAQRADALWQVHINSNNIATCGRQAEEQALMCKVAAPRRPAWRPLSAPAQVSDNPDWCFFHNNFGDKARKCREPCSFPGNARAGRH